MRKIIVLAGKGSLPFTFKYLAEKEGYKVYTVGIKGLTSDKTDFIIPFLGFIEFEKILDKLNRPPIVMLGKFNPKISLKIGQGFLFKLKSILFKDVKKNYEIFQNLKNRIKIFTPKEIINTYISYMESKGYSFLSSDEIKNITAPLLAKEGFLNSLHPDIKLLEEGKTFFKYAKKIADMDIGQTLIFKNGHIVAVEGIEGTNETIKRACKLVGRGFSLIKVGRTQQDFRIDVPTVGLETLNFLSRCKAKAVFLEANNVFVVNKEDFLKEAAKKRIAVIGLKTH
jgi:DUF1009 family protein